MILEVQKLPEADVYKDLVRIPERYRRDAEGRPIRESSICTLTVEGRSTRVSVRGSIKDTAPIIRLDEKTRLALGITDGNSYDFALTPVGWIGQFLWAWNSSDPSSRLAARLGLLSLMLGVISLGLGLISLFD